MNVVRIVADGPCEPGGLLLLLHLKEVMQLSGNGDTSTRMKTFQYATIYWSALAIDIRYRHSVTNNYRHLDLNCLELLSSLHMQSSHLLPEATPANRPLILP